MGGIPISSVYTVYIIPDKITNWSHTIGVIRKNYPDLIIQLFAIFFYLVGIMLLDKSINFVCT